MQPLGEAKGEEEEEEKPEATPENLGEIAYNYLHLIVVSAEPEYMLQRNSKTK